MPYHEYLSFLCRECGNNINQLKTAIQKELINNTQDFDGQYMGKKLYYLICENCSMKNYLKKVYEYEKAGFKIHTGAGKGNDFYLKKENAIYYTSTRTIYEKSEALE